MMTQTRLVNRRRTKAWDVYIGRPSKWGNPFTHLAKSRAPCKVETAEQAIAEYREYLLFERRDLMTQLGELVGKRLACWCSPEPCHGDVLLELVEMWEDGHVCRKCGCTDNSACWDDELGGGCEWEEFGLCSHCVGDRVGTA